MSSTKKIQLQDSDGKWHEAKYYPGGEVYIGSQRIGKAGTVDDAVTVVRQIVNKKIVKIEITDM
jgi:hypothetical protein